ncbi:type II secretion system F family protein [Actinospongicola halichondriae]|uniref:type II secretion system F family protein n=1 Tax=Actinospongicola halichondriae TaxID=3236844 RepID=UPI003D55FAA7
MVIIIGLLFLAAGVGFVILGLRERAEEHPEDDPGEYLKSLDWSDEEADEFQQLLSEPFLTRVLRPIASRLVGTASEVLPGNYRDRIHQQLIYAGLTSQYRAEEIITGQVLLAVVGFVLGLFLFISGVVSSNVGVVLLIGLPIAGAQVPKSFVERKVEERQGAIRRDLPDTLDLLAISVEAGVGFEGALEVVSDNFDSPLANEFSRTLREMELGLPRRQALENLRRRTEVQDLSNFILTLTQADALGMPIGRVLKTQATEMRLKRRAWAREKAAKLPVKILFPLMPILLATFIVVLGPAAASIGGAF